MLAPLLILFGCGTNEDIQESKGLKSKISTLSKEKRQLEKKLKESKEELEEQKLSFAKVESEFNNKLKPLKKKCLNHKTQK